MIISTDENMVLTDKGVKGIIAIVAIICLLIGIGIGWYVKPSPPPPKPTLIVIGPYSGDEMKAFTPVLKAAEEELGIEIEYRIYRAEELSTILPSHFAAGMAPGDVILFCHPVTIRKLAAEGHLIDLSEVIDRSKYPKAILDAVSVNGRVYGAPWVANLKPGLWYRKSFFAKHGLKEPKNWREFIDLLNKMREVIGRDDVIASPDSEGWPLSDIAEHFILYSAGLEAFENLKTGKTRFTDPEIKSALKDTLIWLIENGYFSEPEDWTTIMEKWWNGEYGLYFMGDWVLTMVKDPEDLDLIILTTFDDSASKAITACFPDFIIVPKYTKHPELAVKLAAFLASAKAQLVRVKEGGCVATHKDVPPDAYPASTKRLAERVKGLEIVFDLDDTVGGEFQTAFWDQLKRLWVEPEAYEEVLAKIEEKQPRP